jgi:succinate-semialdehyde dehydrogenase/glutarate-semialdehyde dehydrogenase
MAIATVNPATGQLIQTFEPLSEGEIARKLELAQTTYRSWRKTPLEQRLACLARAAELLEARKETLGRLMTLEMGKPLKSAIEEAAKCAWACRYYVEHAPAFLADEPVGTTASRSFVRYDPIGPVLAVMPWNFPFWQVFRFAAPALAAGNVGLLKHASNVPQCALAIEQLLHDAGVPEGAFQTLLITSRQVAGVLEDPRVKAATLTGSEPAGRQVASQCGRLIKKTVLELGGSDPFIVMPSASVDEAAATAVRARCINNGQSCIAAKRFIVYRSLADAFEARMAEGLRALKVGDPFELSTEIGPLATADILEELDEQVQRTVAAGARVVTGGRRLDGPGNFYAPTLLADITEGSPAWLEEFFGPVALLIRVDSLDEAIEVANCTTFGLGAAAFTNDPEEQARFTDELEAGLVFINGMVASDPRLPFGGVKASGYGRELTAWGMREFMNIKSVWIR